MEAIFTAILNQDIEAVKVYIASGHSLAIKNPYGQSPLQLALVVGNAEITQLLIEQKANFCAVDVSKASSDACQS
ncbi:MAG: ankyrin repeat domain-containing protein [Culicoidibacterales bacterium]